MDTGASTVSTGNAAETLNGTGAAETVNTAAADEAIPDPLGLGLNAKPGDSVDGGTGESTVDGGAKEGDDTGTGGEANEYIGAPAEGEAYALTAPEGLSLDPEMVGVFEPAFRELGLSNKGANKLLADYGANILPKVVDQVAATIIAEQTKALTTAREAMATQLRNDPEIGGDKLRGSMATIAAALDTYGTPALRETVTKSGIGNDLEFARFLMKVGASVQEGTIHTGGTGRQDLTREQKFYDPVYDGPKQ